MLHIIRLVCHQTAKSIHFTRLSYRSSSFRRLNHFKSSYHTQSLTMKTNTTNLLVNNYAKLMKLPLTFSKKDLDKAYTKQIMEYKPYSCYQFKELDDAYKFLLGDVDLPKIQNRIPNDDNSIQKQYYELLELNENTSEEEIDRAYHRMIRKPIDEHKLNEIIEAYFFLRCNYYTNITQA